MRTKLPNQSVSIFAIMSAMAKEHGAINLAQGFPDFESDVRLLDMVAVKMKAGLNQYAPMPGVSSLREAISDKIAALYGTSIDPETDITITAGATQALFNTFAALVHRGDKVIVLEPAYDSYVPAIQLAGGEVVPIAITGPEYRVPWDEVEAAIDSRTTTLVLTNPHNPLGKVFTLDDIEAIRHIAAKHDIIIISDEVYEHLVFDDRPHLSLLNYPELYQKSVVIFSFGKTFHNTGWKMGYSVAPPEITKELRKVHQFNVFSVNTPIQHALADYMKDPATYQDLPSFFQKKRDVLAQALGSTAFRVLDCEGSYFMLVDYSAISDLPDKKFAEWLTKEHGVASIPLSPFYTKPPNEKVVRLCFAKKEETLLAAVEKLAGIK